MSIGCVVGDNKHRRISQSLLDFYFYLFADLDCGIGTDEEVLAIVEGEHLADFALAQLEGVETVGLEVVQMEDAPVLLHDAHPLAGQPLAAAPQVVGDEPTQGQLESFGGDLHLLILAFEFEALEGVHVGVP